MTWIKEQANACAVNLGIEAPLRRGGIRNLTPADQNAIRTAVDADALIATRSGLTGYVRIWGRRRASAWIYLLDHRIGQLGGQAAPASGIANGKVTGIFRGTFAPGFITVVNHDTLENQT